MIRNEDGDGWKSCGDCGEEFHCSRGHDCEVAAYWDWLALQFGVEQ